jgi:hypothetical protein
MTENSQGFYKKEADSVLYGQMIFGPTYMLFDTEHEKHQYPVDGWYWFESKELAYNFFDVELTDA